MIFIEVVLYSFAIVVSLMLGYQMLLSFFAFKSKKTENFVASHNRKFAVILIVNFQNGMLSRSLYSLSGLVYPKNLYDLIVVVEQSDHKSVAVANKLGASVVVCSNGQNSNNEVPCSGNIDQYLKLENYDAVIVFRSDSLVSGNYLEVMNYYLDNGSKVIQSWDCVLPQHNQDNAIASRIESLLSHYVKPMGRKKLGLPQTLRDTGVCISSEVLQKEPWILQSTDISGYGLQLLLEGIKIDFAPEASVWTERPQKDGEVKLKRKNRGYALQLLAAVFVQKSMRFLDIFVEIITPSFRNIMLVVAAMGLLSISAWAVGWLSLLFFWMWLVNASVGIIYLLVGLVSLRDPHLMKSLFYSPRNVIRHVKKFFTGDNKKQGVRQKKNKIISGELEEL